MLTIKPHLNTSILNSPQKVSFNGDKNLLEPFFSIGMTNKNPLARDEFYFHRPDIDENIMLDFLLDPDNNKPFLITGKSNSGKSVLASRLAYKLKQQGYNVFTIDNDCLSKPYKEEQPYLNHTRLNELIEKINNLNTTDRVFIFIDEPQFITANEIIETPIVRYNGKKGVLYKLSEFLNDNPNVKLVGSMLEDGFSHNYYNDTYEHCKIITELFPKENRYFLPPISDYKTEDKIKMLNKALNLAGFKSMPDNIEKRLEYTGIKGPIRSIIFNLFLSLSNDKNRTDDVNHKEEIKKSTWKALIKKVENLNNLNNLIW